MLGAIVSHLTVQIDDVAPGKNEFRGDYSNFMQVFTRLLKN